MRIIDTERRSFIPLRIVYLAVTVIVLVVTGIFLLGKGFWGVLAFFCVNTPLLVISVYWKDDKLKRFNETMSELSQILWPFS
jgi:uncharacterized membrane protein